jgi:tetratricopeptide (TPR) repeat protein
VFSNLEKLPESQRELAKISSVIGNEFRLGELEALVPSSVDSVTLHHDLRDLVEARMISLKNSGVDALYAFEQKLIRDILYNSMPYARRRELHAKLAEYLSAPPDQRGELHAKIALFLDTSVASNPANDAKRIAHHYELADEWLLAAENLISAADFIATQKKYGEAAEIYERAAENLEKVSSSDGKIVGMKQVAYARQADMAMLSEDYPRAELGYRAALSIQKQDEAQESTNDLKRKLALVLPIQDQADEGKKLIQEVLDHEGKAPSLESVVIQTWFLWRERDEETSGWIEKSRASLPEESDSWKDGIEILLSDMEEKWEAVVTAYRMIERPKGAVLASIRFGDRYLDDGDKEKALKTYKQAARILEGITDQDCGKSLLHYRQAEVYWQMEDKESALAQMETAQSFLSSCPTTISKEGRAIFREALKNIKSESFDPWPEWHWQQYDDSIKIGLLFRE